MTKGQDKRPSRTGLRDAAKVLRWLRRGGREQVRAAVQKAVEQTRQRNKARELPADFFNQRFTI